MKSIYIIRQIIMSFIAFLVLTWAFFQNGFWAKMVITPFLIGSFAIFFKNLFLLFNKTKLSKVFSRIFQISFAVYILGFLLYATYYAIAERTYSILIAVAVFALFTVGYLKRVFFKNK